VGKFNGIGPVAAAKMKALGISLGLDLRRQSRALLTEHFGKAGNFYCGIARDEDDRPMSPDRVPKSIGAETTFGRDLERWDEVEPALAPVFVKALGDLQEGRAYRTHRDGEDQIRQLSADHAQLIRSRAHCLAGCAGTYQPGTAALAVSAPARSEIARGYSPEHGKPFAN
jgi:DNA polymerase IV